MRPTKEDVHEYKYSVVAPEPQHERAVFTHAFLQRASALSGLLQRILSDWLSVRRITCEVTGGLVARSGCYPAKTPHSLSNADAMPFAIIIVVCRRSDGQTKVGHRVGVTAEAYCEAWSRASEPSVLHAFSRSHTCRLRSHPPPTESPH
jgi:hypothetical protein